MRLKEIKDQEKRQLKAIARLKLVNVSRLRSIKITLKQMRRCIIRRAHPFRKYH